MGLQMSKVEVLPKDSQKLHKETVRLIKPKTEVKLLHNLPLKLRTHCPRQPGRLDSSLKAAASNEESK